MTYHRHHHNSLHLVLTKRILDPQQNHGNLDLEHSWRWKHSPAEIDLFLFSESTISFGPGFTPLIVFSLSFTLTFAIVFFDIEDEYCSSSFLWIPFHSSKFLRLSFHSSRYLCVKGSEGDS